MKYRVEVTELDWKRNAIMWREAYILGREFPDAEAAERDFQMLIEDDPETPEEAKSRQKLLQVAASMP